MASIIIRNEAWLVVALAYTFMCIKFTKFKQMEMNPYKPLIQALKKNLQKFQVEVLSVFNAQI